MSKNLSGFTDFCHYVGSLSGSSGSGMVSNKRFRFREEFTNIFYASYRKYMNRCGYARRHGIKKKKRKTRWRVKEDHMKESDFYSLEQRLFSLEVQTAALEEKIKKPNHNPNIVINGEEQVFLNSAPDDWISSDQYMFHEPYFEEIEPGLDKSVYNDSETIKHQEKMLDKLGGEVVELTRANDQIVYEHNYWLGILDAFVVNVSVSYSLDLGDLRSVLDNLILVNPQSNHLEDVPESDVTLVSLTLDQIDAIKSDPKVDSTILSIEPESNQVFKPDIKKISPVIRQHSRKRTKLKVFNARCPICKRPMYTEYKCTICDIKSCYYCRGRWGPCYDEYGINKSKDYTFVQPSDPITNRLSKKKGF